MGWPVGRIEIAVSRGLGLLRPSALAAGLALLVLTTAGSGMGSLPLLAQPSGPAASSSPSGGSISVASPSALPTASPTPSPSPTERPAWDIEQALATRASWATYTSARYKFRVSYPAGWTVSETRNEGWVVIYGSDDSNLSLTWRPIPRGTTLSVVTDEVWKAMHDGGFAVVSRYGEMIAGLPAQILVLEGTAPSGHARHGIIGIVVTATGRYRIELWSRPGNEATGVTLFNSVALTFAIV
jgi:hypothetical protein